MKKINLDDLCKIPGAELVSERGQKRSFTNVAIDSRIAGSNDIFFALKGDTHDAHDFIPQVLKNGVSTVVVSSEYDHSGITEDVNIIKVPESVKSFGALALIHRKKFDIPLIGVTGTNGKTTTKEMTAALLSQKYKVLKSEGNFNNTFGLPLTLFQLDDTYQAIVVEMAASTPGEIGLLCDIGHPDYGIITNIGRGHLEFYKTIDEVVNTKSVLIKSVSKKGFVNGDDPRLYPFSEELGNVFSFGFDSKYDVYTDNIKLESDGCYSFRLNGNVKIRPGVPGKVNVYNSLAACCIALELGVSEKLIKEALENFKAYDKRMQVYSLGDISIINDCYNANPDSMRAATSILCEMTSKGRRIAVLGDMLEIGDTSKDEHENLGKHIAEMKIDTLITVGTETQNTSETAVKSGLKSAFHFENHKDAAEMLKGYLKPGDIILVKGSRGSRMEKVLNILHEEMN